MKSDILEILEILLIRIDLTDLKKSHVSKTVSLALNFIVIGPNLKYGTNIWIKLLSKFDSKFE